MDAVELIDKNSRELFTNAIGRIRAGEQIPTIRTKRRTKGGRMEDAVFAVTPITGTDGSVTSIALTEHARHGKSHLH